jgi:polysaccharide biosynthesis protein PslE
MMNEATKRISLRDVFFILFYKIHVFWGTFILIMVLVLGYTFLSRPIYEASGSVLLKPFFDSGQRLHTQERFDVLPVSQQDINTEINIMTSDALLRQVVEQLPRDQSDPNRVDKGAGRSPEAVDEAVLHLRETVEIKPVPLSSIINVSLKGQDPARITQVVNTFLNLYIDRHINVHRPGGGVDFYTQQSEGAHKMLEDAENALMTFQKDLSIIKIEEQRLHNVALIRVLRENVSLLKGEIRRTETILKKLQPFIKAGDVALSAIPLEVRTHEALVDLQKALIPLLVEKERIALMYPANSVEFVNAQNQVKRIEAEIRVQQRQVLIGIELDLVAMVNRMNTLEEEIRTIEKESALLTLHETELNRLQREVEQNKKNYQLYMDIREDAIIQAQRESSRVANVTVTSWASEPSLPVFPKKLLMLALAFVAGLLCGLSSAFAAYFLDHSIKRPEEMQRWFKIPVFASIPEIGHPARPPGRDGKLGW